MNAAYNLATIMTSIFTCGMKMVNFPNCYVQVLHKSVFIAITKKTIQLLLLIFNSVICKNNKNKRKNNKRTKNITGNC